MSIEIDRSSGSIQSLRCADCLSSIAHSVAQSQLKLSSSAMLEEALFNHLINEISKRQSRAMIVFDVPLSMHNIEMTQLQREKVIGRIMKLFADATLIFIYYEGNDGSTYYAYECVLLDGGRLKVRRGQQYMCSGEYGRYVFALRFSGCQYNFMKHKSGYVESSIIRGLNRIE